MTIEDFVRLEPKQIRANKELMQLFVDFYEAAFSFKPSCAGCTFKKGFKKLRAFALEGKKNIKFEKNNIMETKTFEIKKEYRTKILTYKKDGKTYRKYGNQITEEFARELVANGKTEYFKTLPKGTDKIGSKTTKYKVELNLKDGTKELYGSENGLEVKEIDSTKYDSLDYRTELLPLYTELKEKLGKEAKTTKRVDITAFLIENES